jgi:lipoate---protein ligase
MLCITSHTTDPYFNLASEEFLLKSFTEDIFMLYCNEPSVIVGKHQNTFAEINYWYVKEKKIKVVRRLSGGGTVFHDSGNLNFCFISNGREGNLVDFRKFTTPILDVLKKLNVSAERSGRNDLIIKGLKFSGNAEHVYKNRTLHHGTILFSSHLNQLIEALKVDPQKYKDKAVKSVPGKVTNIIDHLSEKISIENFRDIITQHILSKYSGALKYSFSNQDESAISTLVENKYSTWEWNFGYSPKFQYKNEGFIDNKKISFNLEIDKGVITDANICVNSVILNEAAGWLKGVRYDDLIIKEKLRQLKEYNTDLWLSIFF